jgi:putative ABC transport system permease protein
MAGTHEFWLRLKALFRKRRMDREMAEELEFHQAMLREKLLRQGVPEASVEGATRRVFGNSSRWHERLRELWQFRTLEDLRRDASFSIRLLRRSPGFTTVALLTLVLGVGANTSIFSLINGLLLRPLPVPHAEELAVLGIDQGGPKPGYSFPAPFFRSLERRHEAFADVFAFEQNTFQVRGNSNNENINGQFVSGQFFRALEAPALLGRTLTPEDDVTGGNPAGLAVVISEHFWRSWFGGAPDVVGRKLQIDNTIFTVAGVMSKSFTGANPTQRPEIFVPLAVEPMLEGARSMTAAGYHGWWLTVMGRLEPGVTVEQANAALLPISMPIVHEVVSEPGWIARAVKNHFHFTAESGSRGFTYLRFTFRKPLIAVFAMCGGVLLLACLNLASLLMARGAARERELATRLAMGATRGRLIQQLLMESLLIALLGTMIGMAVAPSVSRALAVMLTSGGFTRTVYLDTSLDLRVFGFAALAAVVAAVLIGLVPALQATSRNLHDHIKDGQHATQAHERRRILPRAMLAVEVGLALMLVVGAGLLSTSLMRLYRTGLGFDAKGLTNIALKMDKQSLDSDALVLLYEQFGDALSRQPGVKSVSFARMVPLSNYEWDEDYSVPGGGVHNAHVNGVGPTYFQTMRIPLLEGREYSWTDTTPTGLKIILNKTAARLFFPGRSPIGQNLLLESPKTSYEVIGVVGDAKYDDLRTPPPPTVYPPITQGEKGKPSYTAVVRVEGPAAPLAGAARSIAARLAPDIPAPVITTMDSVLDASISSERVMALLSVFFAACALLVTGIGLYGTLAYATARRTGEIGIRMALGARRAQVVRMVFRENSLIAVVGSAAGLIAAILASRALASFLYSTSSRDPWVMVVSVAAVVLIASAASLIPALRAARIEPMAAIRHE